jgi:hypothetical protein
VFRQLILFLFLSCLAFADSHPVPSPAVDLRLHPYAGRQPVDVTIGLFVTNLAIIEEAREQFEAEGYLTLEWRDPRLVLPDAARTSNHIRRFSPSDLWTPPLETANLISHRAGNILLEADDQGNVRYVERSDTVVSNPYSLRRFPFDSQTLTFYIEPFLPATPEIQFAAKPASWTGLNLGNHSLAAWDVRDLTYRLEQLPQSGPIPPHSAAIFQIDIRRRSGFYVWKILLPIFLMAAIPWLVFWSQALDFSDQISVPLGIMLSMIAFQFAIARDLPRPGYLSFLDAVILTSFIFVALCMAEVLTVHLLEARGRVAASARIRRTSRWLFPIAYICAIALLAILF